MSTTEHSTTQHDDPDRKARSEEFAADLRQDSAHVEKALLEIAQAKANRKASDSLSLYFVKKYGDDPRALSALADKIDSGELTITFETGEHTIEIRSLLTIRNASSGEKVAALHLRDEVESYVGGPAGGYALDPDYDPTIDYLPEIGTPSVAGVTWGKSEF